MIGAILNIAMGAFCLVCGLGNYAQLIGTKTGTPLAILGGVLLALGLFRLWRWRSRRRRAIAAARERDLDEGIEP